MILRFPYQLPRNAFSHRDAARAGDVWRAFQDVAVGAASRAGWPPSRMRTTGTAFVVRSMTVVHHRETHFGEPLEGASWVRRFRRDTLCTREVRLLAEDGPVASGMQEWVHVDGNGKPARAPQAMVESFVPHEEGGVELPGYEGVSGESPRFRFSFRPWHVYMDPLDHLNHPAYVDACDEAIARVVVLLGFDPASVAPVAESVTFLAPIDAGDEVTVTSWLSGRTSSGDAVIAHVLDTAEREGVARATTVRRLVTTTNQDLAEALSSPQSGRRG